MRYCLGTRIRGLLLGAAMGEHQAICQWGKGNRLFSSYLLRSCELIISPTGRGFEDLWEFFGSELGNWDSQPKDSYLTERLIMSSLSVGLFCHDNLQQLRSRLRDLANQYPIDRISWDWIDIFTHTLALFLREESKLERFIPTLLNVTQPSSEVASVIMLIENWQQNHQPLASIETELNQVSLKTHTKMAIALYCLLSSGEDLRLSIARAGIARDYIGITTIVGALSGAYNGEIAIPLEWYFDLANMSGTVLEELNCVQVLKLADELLASWSGVHMGALQRTESELIWAVASPNIMRPR